MPQRMTIGPGMMLLSAGLFGYFGFMTAFLEIDPATNTLIPLVVTLKWTLRVAAIAFLAAALLTMVAELPGNLLYAAIGVLTAIAFVVVAIWDWSSTWMSGIHPVLLLVFAAWNGYGSWGSLMACVRGAPGSG